MQAEVKGLFLGVIEIQVKDKPNMKMIELMQQTSYGHEILRIPFDNGYQVPKENTMVTIPVAVSAFVSKKDGTAKLGTRLVQVA